MTSAYIQVTDKERGLDEYFPGGEILIRDDEEWPGFLRLVADAPLLLNRDEAVKVALALDQFIKHQGGQP